MRTPPRVATVAAVLRNLSGFKMNYMQTEKMKYPHSAKTGIAAALAMVAAISLAGIATSTAKDAPAPSTATPCNPIKSLSYKFTPRTTDAGLVVMNIDYSVSPCDKKAPGSVSVQVFEKETNALVFTQEPAPFSGKTKAADLKARTFYTIVISVYDAKNKLVESRSVDAIYLVTSV